MTGGWQAAKAHKLRFEISNLKCRMVCLRSHRSLVTGCMKLRAPTCIRYCGLFSGFWKPADTIHSRQAKVQCRHDGESPGLLRIGRVSRQMAIIMRAATVLVTEQLRLHTEAAMNDKLSLLLERIQQIEQVRRDFQDLRKEE